MRTRDVLHSLAVLWLAASCARGPTPLSEADKATIRANDEKFAQAVVAKNWPGLAAMYSTDAAFMPPNESVVQGRAAIQSWMSAFPPVTAFSLTPQQVDGQGNLAYVRGTYMMTVTPPGAPAPVEDHGKYIVIERKQPDGSWLITEDIFNSDVPLPAPAP
jgi:ketosteroid isomerase-like protein